MANWQFWSPYMNAWRKTWNRDMKSVKSRFYAFVDMFFIDHGFFRAIYPNRYKVAEQLERQNHPTPWGVASAAKRGIKTIINLRGDNELGSTVLSKKAAARHGIKVVDLRTASRSLPSKQLIIDAKKIFDEVEYPALLHCKSGADRAGLMSALFLMLHEGRPVEEAKQQLHWRYGHMRQTNTGILDAFLEAYEEANKQKPIDFLKWVEEEYDPAAIQKTYKSKKRNWLANFFYDRILNRE